MSSPRDIAVLVGSLRKESFNRKMARAIAEIAPPSLSFEIVEIGGLPFYNADDEASPPEPWKQFRARIRRANGILFITPEYNRSIPAVLKNAIDVGSRPPPESVWRGKPAAIVTLSPGLLGGFGANHHLRQMLVPINVPTMPAPEAYIGGAAKLFDEAGKLVNDDTRAFLKKFTEAFAAWVERHAAG
jgi:chromate reductase